MIKKRGDPEILLRSITTLHNLRKKTQWCSRQAQNIDHPRQSL